MAFPRPQVFNGLLFDRLSSGHFLDGEVTGAPDTDGNVMKLIARSDTGDVVLGFPVDGSASSYAGSVRFGVGYAGNRAFIFQVDDDAGGSTEVLAVDDAALDFKGQIGAKNLKVLTNSNFDYAPDVPTNEMKVRLAAGTKFVFYNGAGAVVFEIDETGALHGKTGQSLAFDR